MTSTKILLQKTLQTHGYSYTTVRQAVYQALAKAEPLTMAELIAACPRNINRASIYRTISLFETLGIVQRLQIGWKYRLELSNDFQDHHHHATCHSCGRVIALPEDTALENSLNHIAKAANFIASDHQIELQGICQNCQARSHKP